MNFQELIKIEPRLQELYNEARLIQANDKKFCANHIWCRDFKPRLLTLVGWGATFPDLRSTKAYDLAYDAIYNALPDCGQCCNCI